MDITIVEIQLTGEFGGHTVPAQAGSAPCAA